MSVKPLEMVLVDDDTLVHELVARRLEASCVDLTSFVDELLALEHLQQLKPDVLIIDHRMPRLDGIELLQRLGKARPSHTYLCSGGPLSPAVKLAAQDLGVELLSKDTLAHKDGLPTLIAKLA